MLTDERNVFTVDIEEDNLFANSKVYGAFQFVLDEEIVDVIEAIDALEFTTRYRRYPKDVAAARKAYDALDEDIRYLVTNYDELLVIEARVDINNLIREIDRADLDEKEYTEDSWAALEEAYEAAVKVRDNRDAAVEAIEKEHNDLRNAFDDLMTKKEAAFRALLERVKELEERVNNLEEENGELGDELNKLRDELGKLRDSQDAADDKIKELEDRIAELEKEVEDLASRPAPTEPTDEDDSGEKPTDDSKVDGDDVKSPDTNKEDDNKPASAGEKVKAVKSDNTIHLPKTGVSTSGIGVGIASLLSGLGLAFVGKKRKEDD